MFVFQSSLDKEVCINCHYVYCLCLNYYLFTDFQTIEAVSIVQTTDKEYGQRNSEGYILTLVLHIILVYCI